MPKKSDFTPEAYALHCQKMREQFHRLKQDPEKYAAYLAKRRAKKVGRASTIKWKRKNPERVKELNRVSYEKNKKSIFLRRKLRLAVNPNAQIAMLLRARMNAAVDSNAKIGSAVRDLGCTIAELKLHLAAKFTDGMTWGNRGRHGWHIDHIIPLSAFDLSNREQFLRAAHYTNLQPLWAFDNLSKGASHDELLDLLDT